MRECARAREREREREKERERESGCVCLCVCVCMCVPSCIHAYIPKSCLHVYMYLKQNIYWSQDLGHDFNSYEWKPIRHIPNKSYPFILGPLKGQTTHLQGQHHSAIGQPTQHVGHVSVALWHQPVPSLQHKPSQVTVSIGLGTLSFTIFWRGRGKSITT